MQHDTIEPLFNFLYCLIIFVGALFFLVSYGIAIVQGGGTTTSTTSAPPNYQQGAYEALSYILDHSEATDGGYHLSTEVVQKARELYKSVL
jgi:hypothetical protein